MRVLTKRDVAVTIVQQPSPPGAYVLRNLGGAVPFVVDQLGGVEPGLLLRREGDVRPRLMRRPGEQQSFGYAEA